MPQPNPEPPESDHSATVRANRLIAMFFEDPRLFGQLREVEADEVPPAQRRLLDHRSHMTVTMEAFVGATVSLRVLDERRDGAAGPAERRGHYAREIELVSPSGQPVQYGIVTVDLSAVPPVARERILAGSAPLGRVLIESGTLRDVHDVSLVRITVGPELARRLGIAPGRTLHGRVATISLTNGVRGPTPFAGVVDPAMSAHSVQAAPSAVELLEIPLVG